MKGLLLHPLPTPHPGQSFWPCFAPLRQTFHRLCWILPSPPWFGTPPAFDHDRETACFDPTGQTTTMLWRPGALTRWATHFAEEYIELFGIDPADDPAQRATDRAPDFDAFLEEHVRFWLIYRDSTCWEIFARDQSALDRLRHHLHNHPRIRAHESTAADRGPAFTRAGLDRP